MLQLKLSLPHKYISKTPQNQHFKKKLKQFQMFPLQFFSGREFSLAISTSDIHLKCTERYRAVQSWFWVSALVSGWMVALCHPPQCMERKFNHWVVPGVFQQAAQSFDLSHPLLLSNRKRVNSASLPWLDDTTNRQKHTTDTPRR